MEWGWLWGPIAVEVEVEVEALDGLGAGWRSGGRRRKKMEIGEVLVLGEGGGSCNAGVWVSCLLVCWDEGRLERRDGGVFEKMCLNIFLSSFPFSSLWSKTPRASRQF